MAIPLAKKLKMKINLKGKIPDIRHLDDMRDVLYDQKWLKTAPDAELYYMYRGIKPPHLFIGGGDKKNNDLRYDITIIPAKTLGKEFVKTKGHQHIGNYGELYIVLNGKAIYLAQKRENKEITDIFAIKAKKDDIAIIPPGYEHITINPSKKETLKMANWVSENCRNNYQPIQKMGGACYFYTEDGWLKNKNYKKIPKLRFKKPRKTMPIDLDFLRG